MHALARLIGQVYQLRMSGGAWPLICTCTHTPNMLIIGSLPHSPEIGGEGDILYSLYTKDVH